ncbi:OB-fold domain-containing protein [Cycloclasticus sp.]|uniref:Zn-ribbon domain-containing OB-fold protein n=1 Tax=Cycloclasticus sp. TaxID=2024830 RepID=UPI000C0F5139|nr:OB-fold domain-containing protein [Cycloclasticus sp.]PHR50605.1 MAG: hypothetical protein COA48_03940 [Cycloclasticus sp.]
MEYPKEDIIWPTVVDIAKPYYEAMQQHKLLIQNCSSCQTSLPPAQKVCDECGGNELEWFEAKGTGIIYSYVVFHRSFHPYYDDKIPYTVALVELTEGPRVMGHIVASDGQPYQVGTAVRAHFKKIDKKNELLYFKLDGEEH